MNIYKKFLIILVSINILVALACFNYFQANAAVSIENIESGASGFIAAGKDKATDVGDVTTAITSNFTGVGQILTMVGAGVMVAATTFMGIKYIISPPDKQAALKQQLIGLVAAGIVIFGAYGIWKAVLGVVQNFD